MKTMANATAWCGALLMAACGAARAADPGIMLGVYLSSQQYEDALQGFDEAAGKTHTHVMYFVPFEGYPNLAQFLNTLGKMKKVPVICWQSGDDGKPDRSYSNQSFIDGEHDEDIEKMAGVVKKFLDDHRSLPVYIRWAHEANIRSAPAWPGHPWNNRSAAQYIGMFQHVHDTFFKKLDAGSARARVVWVWSPNYENAAEGHDSYSDWKNLYPGDRYVDMTGLSGLNYGDHPTAGPGFPVTVQWLYLPILRDMMAGEYGARAGAAVSPAELAQATRGKPQGIFEFGSVETRRRGGARGVMPTAYSDIPKEDWIRHGYAAIANAEEFGFVRLVMIYNDIATSGGYRCDFRVWNKESAKPNSPVPASVTQAYKEAIEDPRFTDDILTLEDMLPGGYHRAESLPVPAAYPQHEFWLSPPPGGTVYRNETLTAAFFLHPAAHGPAMADAYVAARIPGGGFYAFVPPAGWVRFDPAGGQRPPAVARGVHVIREVRAIAFIQPMGAGLPAGDYRIYSILVPPGADPLRLGPDLKEARFTLAG